MKKLIFCTSLLLVVTACQDAFSPFSDGTVLSEIRYESNNQTWTDKYEYTDDGQVRSVTSDNGLVERDEFTYANGRLLEKRTVQVQNNRLVFRDSMVYNANGQVAFIYKYSINEGADLPLSSIESLTYDGEGQLIEVSTEFVRVTDYKPRKVYRWRDGNAIQADYYDGDVLQQEFFFTYDDRPALQFENFTNPGNLSLVNENNLIHTDWVDYSGVLDTVCKPCEIAFVYNLNGLPIFLQTNWNLKATFIYQELAAPID